MQSKLWHIAFLNPQFKVWNLERGRKISDRYSHSDILHPHPISETSKPNPTNLTGSSWKLRQTECNVSSSLFWKQTVYYSVKPPHYNVMVCIMFVFVRIWFLWIITAFTLSNTACTAVSSLRMSYSSLEWVVITKKARKSYDANSPVFCLCFFFKVLFGG